MSLSSLFQQMCGAFASFVPAPLNEIVQQFCSAVTSLLGSVGL